MKRPVFEVDEKKMAKRIKNRESARRSIEKKKNEIEDLKKENQFLRIRNDLLEERISKLELILLERHSSLSFAVIQKGHPLVDLHGL